MKGVLGVATGFAVFASVFVPIGFPKDLTDRHATAVSEDILSVKNIAVFGFAHSLWSWPYAQNVRRPIFRWVSWPYTEVSVPADPARSVGSGLCHVAAAAGIPCCAHGRYLQRPGRPGLARVQASYGSPVTVASIDAGGQQDFTAGVACAGGAFTSFADTAFTHFVTVSNNFNIETDDSGNWVGWIDQSFFADDTNTLFRFAKDSKNPSARILYYEVPPQLDTLTTFSAWITDDEVGQTGRGWARFAALHEAVQDEMNAARPTPDVYLVPFNRLMAQALGSGGPLDGLTLNDFAWDTAPHYREEFYWLAGVLHYMVITGQQPPENYTLPSYVSTTVATAFPQIVSDWFTAINTEPLRSRVFGPLPSPSGGP